MRACIASACLSLGLLLATPAPAQPRPIEDANMAETGEIVALDAEARSFTVKDSEGVETVFVVDPKASVTASQKGDGVEMKDEIDFADLAVGQQVALNADLRDGKKVVTYIEVVDDPASGD